MLAKLMQRHATENPDFIRAIDPDETLTNAEFDLHVRALAGWLLELGIEPAQPVAVCAHNSVRWLVTNVGLIAAGGLMAPMTYRTTPEELAYLLTHSKCRVAIVDGSTAAMVVSVASTTPDLEYVVSLDDTTLDIPGVRCVTYREVVGHAPLATPTEIAGTSMAFTSGTTGRPKGVYRDPARTSESSGASPLTLFDLRPDDVHLCAGPLYHGGPHGFAIMTLALGGRVVILPRFDPAAVAEAIERHHVTTTFMVPTMLRLFTKYLESARHCDLSTMRVVITAGEPCPMPLKRDIARLVGPVLYEFFGATELGINALMTPEGHELKPGSCGKLLPNQEFRVLGEDGKPLPPGEEGELVVHNETLPEYWQEPEATKAAMRGKAMSLGDTGYVDEDGYLFVTGRKVDLIKTGGVRVTPTEIEAVLLEHPAVLEVAVVGLPDEVWTERITACVLPIAGTTPDRDELKEWCSARLASHKVPKQVEFFDRDTWPRLENGKVPKRFLRDLLIKRAAPA